MKLGQLVVQLGLVDRELGHGGVPRPDDTGLAVDKLRPDVPDDGQYHVTDRDEVAEIQLRPRRRHGGVADRFSLRVSLPVRAKYLGKL